MQENFGGLHFADTGNMLLRAVGCPFHPVFYLPKFLRNHAGQCGMLNGGQHEAPACVSHSSTWLGRLLSEVEALAGIVQARPMYTLC